MSAERNSAPAASSIETLAGDILARRTRELLDALYSAGFEPIRDALSNTRQALESYQCVREGSIINNSDPQKMNSEVAPTTERSVRDA